MMDKAEKRAAFLRMKELAGEGRLVPTPRKGFTPKQRQSVYDKGEGCCVHCGRNVGLKFEIDHRVSLFRGGAHDLENWELCCPDCHLEKTRVEAGGNASIRRIERVILEGKPPSRLQGRGFNSRGQAPMGRLKREALREERETARHSKGQPR